MSKLPDFATITEAEDYFVDAFSWLDDWQQKYQYIIDLGKNLSDLPIEEKIEENRIRGCQSQVWMVIALEGQRMHIRAASDSAIVAGLIVLIISLYANKTAQDIQAYDHGFVDRLGLSGHLSPTRSNGLHHMLTYVLNFFSRKTN